MPVFILIPSPLCCQVKPYINPPPTFTNMSGITCSICSFKDCIITLLALSSAWSHPEEAGICIFWYNLNSAAHIFNLFRLLGVHATYKGAMFGHIPQLRCFKTTSKMPICPELYFHAPLMVSSKCLALVCSDLYDVIP